MAKPTILGGISVNRSEPKRRNVSYDLQNMIPPMTWGFEMTRSVVLESVANRKHVYSLRFQLVTFPHALRVLHSLSIVCGIIGY